MSYRVLNWDEGTVGWKCTERAGDWRIIRDCSLQQNRNICKHYMPGSSFLLRGACSVQITALWPHSVLNAKPSLPAGACKQFSLTPSHRGGSKIPNVLCRLLLQPTHRVIRAVPVIATGTQSRTPIVIDLAH